MKGDALNKAMAMGDQPHHSRLRRISEMEVIAPKIRAIANRHIHWMRESCSPSSAMQMPAVPWRWKATSAGGRSTLASIYWSRALEASQQQRQSYGPVYPTCLFFSFSQKHPIHPISGLQVVFDYRGSQNRILPPPTCKPRRVLVLPLLVTKCASQQSRCQWVNMEVFRALAAVSTSLLRNRQVRPFLSSH